MSVHEKIKNLKCGHCDARFSFKNTLKIHILRVHGKAKVQCESCERPMSGKDNLKCPYEYENIYLAQKFI